jgi:hypothetical protein
MTKTVEEIMDELRKYPHIFRGSGRFEPKLTFDERCSVLALYLSGVHRRVLAAAFGIDRRTVAHIYNPHSIHYKAVRKQLEVLGREVFIRRYLTEEATVKVRAVQNHREVTLSDDEMREEPSHAPIPNRKRNRKEGVHVLKPEQCEYSHRVVIGWREAVNDDISGSPAGWYYQDLDGNDPELWFHSGPESLLSSQNALKGAEPELLDKF